MDSRVTLGSSFLTGDHNLIFVWQLFAQLDTNDDGQLSKAELIQGVKGLSQEELLGFGLLACADPSSAKEISDFVTAVDSDDDKKISLDEWVAHFNVFEPAAAAAAAVGAPQMAAAGSGPGNVDARDDGPDAVYDGPDSGLCSFGRREDGDLDALEDKGMCSSCSMQ